MRHRDYGLKDCASQAKKRLLNTFQESENKKIKRLIRIKVDNIPSQFLRQMKSLGRIEFCDKVLRTLWIERMPNSVQNILIISEESPEKLAKMANKIIEMRPEMSECAAVQKTLLSNC